MGGGNVKAWKSMGDAKAWGRMQKYGGDQKYGKGECKSMEGCENMGGGKCNMREGGGSERGEAKGGEVKTWER